MWHEHDRDREREPAPSQRDEANRAEPEPAARSAAAAAGNAAVTRLLRGGGPGVHRSELASQGAGPLDPDVAAAIAAERGGGSPLPEPVRAEMEQQFGADLSTVRVHSGPAAAGLNQAVQAEAFTSGTDVFVGPGYDPASAVGRELLAHELTHVVQQATGTAGADDRVSHPDDAAEAEARDVAREVGRGAPAAGLGTAGDPAAAVARHPAGPGATAEPGDTAEAEPVDVGAGPAPGTVVLRHASAEHALMGDSRPGELASAVGRVAPEQRGHVLGQELRRAVFFRDNPQAVPDTGPGGLFEGIRVIQLTGSQLHVTYGEINALADYLPNGQEINTMSADHLIPILQHMREVIAKACSEARGSAVVDGERQPTGDWSGAQRPSTFARVVGVASEDAAGLLTEEAATAQLGFQSYTGLLSRNACHFAPMSWERWAQNHSRAIQSALEAHGFQSSAGAGGTDEHKAAAETQAWVHNGYADHFLEDSFAAGHLINKTLVMQWFMEYARSRKPLPTKIQMPDDEMVRAMGTASQQHVAGQDIYQVMEQAQQQRYAGGPPVQAPAVMPTDPQTASEARGGLGATDRAELAGVQPVPGMSRGQVAHQWQRFLSNAFLQKAAGEVHNYFNALTTGGLRVRNGAGQTFLIGGDDTQLALSDPAGAQVVVDAVNLSRRRVEETIATGTSSIQAADVLMLVPTEVLLAGPTGNTALDLQSWNETRVKQFCDELFPQVYDSVAANIVRRLGPLPETPDPDLAATR